MPFTVTMKSWLRPTNQRIRGVDYPEPPCDTAPTIEYRRSAELLAAEFVWRSQKWRRLRPGWSTRPPSCTDAAGSARRCPQQAAPFRFVGLRRDLHQQEIPLKLLEHYAPQPFLRKPRNSQIPVAGRPSGSIHPVPAATFYSRYETSDTGCAARRARIQESSPHRKRAAPEENRPQAKHSRCFRPVSHGSDWRSRRSTQPNVTATKIP